MPTIILDIHPPPHDRPSILRLASFACGSAAFALSAWTVLVTTYLLG